MMPPQLCLYSSRQQQPFCILPVSQLHTYVAANIGETVNVFYLTRVCAFVVFRRSAMHAVCPFRSCSPVAAGTKRPLSGAVRNFILRVQTIRSRATRNQSSTSKAATPSHPSPGRCYSPLTTALLSRLTPAAVLYIEFGRSATSFCWRRTSSEAGAGEFMEVTGARSRRPRRCGGGGCKGAERGNCRDFVSATGLLCWGWTSCIS